MLGDQLCDGLQGNESCDATVCTILCETSFLSTGQLFAIYLVLSKTKQVGYSR
jgi:hypothetical protein